MTTKREGFFGTDNLHRAGWTALIGLFGFVGGLAYQKINGPQKVVVEPLPTYQNNQITAKIAPSSKEVADLTNAIQKLAQATTSEPEKKRLRELTAEVDRLRAEVSRSKPPNATPLQSKSQSPKASGNIDSTSTAVLAEKFQLPDTARGYTSAKIFGVSSLSCPPSKIFKSSILTIGFVLTDSSLISLVSPVRVTVDQILSQTNFSQVVQLWAKLYEGENTISFEPKLNPGNYRITYGFFRKDQLSGEFPPLYSKECDFQVT